MGTYISQSSIESVYGTDNVAAWSDLTGGDTVDTTRVANAISYAERYVENMFRTSQYAIPFTQGTSSSYDYQLTDWMAAIAGDWLYRSRQIRRRASRALVDVGTGEGITSATIQRVRLEMRDALAGKIKLDAGYKSTPITEGPVCIF